MKYEMVVGLEVHVELKTKAKLFCSCENVFGAPADTVCCPICRGLPGTLPHLNRNAVLLALKAGKALGCNINKISSFARKNYFYPDLPKGYQITQGEIPLLSGGVVKTGEGNVRIHRIHIEEDAGKLKYDGEGNFISDFNRCGVPLIEIVSEPDIHSPAQAVEYLKKLRLMLLYAGVSDCKMQEGSMRCDVNISVREEGADKTNERTEIKNVSSFKFVEKALLYEYKRQLEILEGGGRIERMTMRINESTGETEPMRKKESSEDYRYFPEPDLPPLVISEDEILSASDIGKSPDEIKEEYISKYNIPENICDYLIERNEYREFFERCIPYCENPSKLSNIITTELFARFSSPDGLNPSHIGELTDLYAKEEISGKTMKYILDIINGNPNSPKEIISEKNLRQINDRQLLLEFVNKAVELNPKAVEDYKKGKTASAGRITGEALKLSGGRGNPAIIKKLSGEVLGKLL